MKTLVTVALVIAGAVRVIDLFQRTKEEDA